MTIFLVHQNSYSFPFLRLLGRLPIKQRASLFFQPLTFNRTILTLACNDFQKKVDPEFLQTKKILSELSPQLEFKKLTSGDYLVELAKNAPKNSASLGYKLLKEVIEHNKEIKIKVVDTDGAFYNWEDKNDLHIKYQPTGDRYRVVVVDHQTDEWSLKRRKDSIILGHELIHAYRYLKGINVPLSVVTLDGAAKFREVINKNKFYRINYDEESEIIYLLDGGYIPMEEKETVGIEIDNPDLITENGLAHEILRHPEDRVLYAIFKENKEKTELLPSQWYCLCKKRFSKDDNHKKNAENIKLMMDSSDI